MFVAKNKLFVRFSPEEIARARAYIAKLRVAAIKEKSDDLTHELIGTMSLVDDLRLGYELTESNQPPKEREVMFVDLDKAGNWLRQNPIKKQREGMRNFASVLGIGDLL